MTEPTMHLFSTEWFTNAGAALACIMGASIAAGLTMGLLSIPVNELEVAIAVEENGYPLGIDSSL